jgi:hypothetical protein
VRLECHAVQRTSSDGGKGVSVATNSQRRTWPPSGFSVVARVRGRRDGCTMASKLRGLWHPRRRAPVAHRLSLSRRGVAQNAEACATSLSACSDRATAAEKVRPTFHTSVAVGSAAGDSLSALCAVECRPRRRALSRRRSAAGVLRLRSWCVSAPCIAVVVLIAYCCCYHHGTVLPLRVA